MIKSQQFENSCSKGTCLLPTSSSLFFPMRQISFSGPPLKVQMRPERYKSSLLPHPHCSPRPPQSWRLDLRTLTTSLVTKEPSQRKPPHLDHTGFGLCFSTAPILLPAPESHGFPSVKTSQWLPKIKAKSVHQALELSKLA